MQALLATQRHPVRALTTYIAFSSVMVLFVSVAGFVLLIAVRNLAAGTLRLADAGSARWVVRPRPLMLGSGLLFLALAGLAFTTVPLGAIFYMVGT